MPTVLVSMPAYNAAPFISHAIESVLRQDGVDLQLVVVDDASTDETAAIAGTFADRGVILLRNAERRGIGACHNLVIEAARRSGIPLIAHVDADDLVLPGGIAAVARAVLADDRVGQGYCDFYPIAADGSASRETIEWWRAFFALTRAAPIDQQRELIAFGMVVSALRIYRLSVFDVVGPFDERLPWAVDYEMALRLAERFRFAHVPEMLYARRVHDGGVTQRLRGKAWRFWRMRWTLVRRRLRANGGSIYGRGSLATYALLLLGLIHDVRDSMRSVRILS